MTVSTIRKRLIDDITNASESDIKELYKLHALIKEEKSTGLTWDALTSPQILKINDGLKQLKEGKGIPVKKAMAQLNNKYGLS